MPHGTHNLDPDDRERLTKLLGRLGSDFDGERATAGRMAHELVRSKGLSWGDVLVAPAIGEDVHQVITRLLQSQTLTSWERSFLRSCASFADLSHRQQQTIERIRLKVELADA